jgi:hypothetical protein
MTDQLARHIIAVWNYMNDNAVDGEFQGNLTGVFTELNISRTYYSPIWNVLEEGGYVSRAARGGGRTPSTVYIHLAPQLNVLLLTEPPKAATVPLVRRIEELESALGGIDIVGVLRNYGTRIEALERSHGISSEISNQL